MPRKKKRVYGKYIEEIDGVLYASVNIPQENGKYKRKRILYATLGSKPNEAVKWASGELEKNKLKIHSPLDSLTFAQAVEWYKPLYLVAPVLERGVKVDGTKDWQKSRNKLDRMAEFFGSQLIVKIKDEDLKRYIAHRRDIDEVLTATINRDFALLKTMFKRLRKKYKELEIPDFPINMAAETERDRIMTHSEEKQLLAACVEKETITYKYLGRDVTREIEAKRTHLKPIIILAVDTGMRAGEIFKLVWDDVDFDTDKITVHFFNAKTEKTRIIGMTPRVKRELLILSEGAKSEKIFPYKRLYHSFPTACERANIKDLHFHDLRHTATTRMIRAGIPSAEVMKITGHTQVKTFLRYLNLVNETIQSNANQLAEYNNSVEIQESETLQ